MIRNYWPLVEPNRHCFLPRSSSQGYLPVPAMVTRERGDYLIAALTTNCFLLLRDLSHTKHTP